MAITKLHTVLTYLQKNKKLTNKQISQALAKDLETTTKILNGTKKILKKDLETLAYLFSVDHYIFLLHWQVDASERTINANMQIPNPNKNLVIVNEMLKDQTKELSKTLLKLYKKKSKT
jgi:hypothetical protein